MYKQNRLHMAKLWLKQQKKGVQSNCRKAHFMYFFFVLDRKRNNLCDVIIRIQFHIHESNASRSFLFQCSQSQ